MYMHKTLKQKLKMTVSARGGEFRNFVPKICMAKNQKNAKKYI